MAIKARRIATKTRLQAAAKKGGTPDEEWITYLSVDSPTLNLRFVTEPEDWIEYTEHYSEEYRFYPCSDDCPGCRDGADKSKKFLVAAIDVEEAKVKFVKLGKTVVSTLYHCYENNGTVMDRDYQITRTGSGMKTEYIVIPSQPTRVKFSRFPLPEGSESWAAHCLTMLESRLPDNQDGANSDEEVPPRKTTKKQPPATPSRGRVQPKKSSLYDYDDEDENDEEEEAPPLRRSAVRPPPAPARRTLKPLKPRR